MTESKTQTDVQRAKLWQYVVCPAAVAYGVVALVGTFVHFNFVCVAMLLAMASVGATAGACQVVLGLHGKARLVTSAFFIVTSVLFAVWSTDLWLSLVRLAFWKLA